MSTAALWVTIVAMALITFALRSTFLLLHEKITFPPIVSRALRYVPYAVLAALVVPALFGGDGRQTYDVQPERLFAALLGALVAWRTRSVILTLVIGMSSLWIVQLLV